MPSRRKKVYVPTTDFSHVINDLKWYFQFTDKTKATTELVLALNDLNNSCLEDTGAAQLKLLMLGLDDKVFFDKETAHVLALHARRENTDKIASLQYAAGLFGPDNISKEGAARMAKYVSEAIKTGALWEWDACKTLHFEREDGRQVASFMTEDTYNKVKKAVFQVNHSGAANALPRRDGKTPDNTYSM